MGRKRLAESDKLQMVAGSVPLPVAEVLRRMAKEDSGTTLSVVVRRVIEESPRIKAALKNGGKIRGKK